MLQTIANYFKDCLYKKMLRSWISRSRYKMDF